LGLAALLYWLTASLTGVFIGLFVGRLPLNFILPRYVAVQIPGSDVNGREIAGLMVSMALAYLLSQIWVPHGWLALIGSAAVAVAIGGVTSYGLIFSHSSRTRAQKWVVASVSRCNKVWPPRR